MVMKTYETEAILNYLEFTLTKMVERIQLKCPDMTDEMIGVIYDEVYESQNEMQRTLQENISPQYPKKIS